MATDPVCGMYVDERTAGLTLVRENRTYYFCAESCLQEFSTPEKRLSELRWRLAVAWPLSVGTFLLVYLLRVPLSPWIELGLAGIVQFYPGLQFYRGTYDALRSRIWNMDVLIAVGTSVAFFYSAADLLLPGRVPASYFFDASALIITLILTGNYLEHLTRERARGALRKLKEVLPSLATVVREGREHQVPVSEVLVNDLVRVLPGGRLPVDGVIVGGRSAVNESLITGESLPVDHGPGDPVIGGTINGESALLVRATKVGEDTVLAQIAQLVTEAETSRVPLQRLADRIASVFVPTVLALAVLASVAWFALGVGPTVALLVFVSVAITACPCAFGIATPAAIVVGTGRAAEEGVLFKGGDSLERASRIDIVLSDKTGTITAGEPSLTDIVPGPGVAQARLLALAAGLETGSEHPLAVAVLREARRQHVAPEELTEVRTSPGCGVDAVRAGRPLSISRGTAARETAVGLGSLRSAADRLEREGKTWSVVVEGGEPLGILGFSDAPAPGVSKAIRALARDGVPVVMVTGDNTAAARFVAGRVGIQEVHADMRPEGKLALIRDLQKKGRRVAFVGDGINDAPALSAADLGIAIGAGTDVAKESGGVILVRSDFSGVALALRLGRRTVGKVRGNIAWALGYNAVLLPVAAGALVPFFGLRIFEVLPITGALAMGLSSTSVVLNSLSLRLVSISDE